MQAMVLRIQERDKQKTQQKGQTVVEAANVADVGDSAVVSELRKKARQKYLLQREDDQMLLQKKILDDEK